MKDSLIRFTLYLSLSWILALVIFFIASPYFESTGGISLVICGVTLFLANEMLIAYHKTQMTPLETILSWRKKIIFYSSLIMTGLQLMSLAGFLFYTRYIMPDTHTHTALPNSSTIPVEVGAASSNNFLFNFFMNVTISQILMLSSIVFILIYLFQLYTLRENRVREKFSNPDPS